jgi:hypothetical protein
MEVKNMDGNEKFLEEIALGAAASQPKRDLRPKQPPYRGGLGQYQVLGCGEELKPLARTPTFLLYPTETPSGQLGLFKLAFEATHNGLVRREFDLLQRLQRRAQEIDAEVVADGGSPLLYGAQFPTSLESVDAGERFGMFLGFHESIKHYSAFQPIGLLLRDEFVDLRTAAWVLGKGLRLLDFAHRLNSVTVGFIGPSNLLLETVHHGVFVLDWSRAQEFNSSVARQEVISLAKIIWWAVGGTAEAEPPLAGEVLTAEGHNQYVAFLQRLVAGELDAGEAHAALYRLADELWEREIIPDNPPRVPPRTKRHFHLWRTFTR